MNNDDLQALVEAANDEVIDYLVQELSLERNKVKIYQEVVKQLRDENDRLKSLAKE